MIVGNRWRLTRDSAKLSFRSDTTASAIRGAFDPKHHTDDDARVERRDGIPMIP